MTSARPVTSACPVPQWYTKMCLDVIHYPFVMAYNDVAIHTFLSDSHLPDLQHSEMSVLLEMHARYDQEVMVMADQGT